MNDEKITESRASKRSRNSKIANKYESELLKKSGRYSLSDAAENTAYHPIRFRDPIFSSIKRASVAMSHILSESFSGTYLVIGARSSGKSVFSHMLVSVFVSIFSDYNLNIKNKKSIVYSKKDSTKVVEDDLFEEMQDNSASDIELFDLIGDEMEDNQLIMDFSYPSVVAKTSLEAINSFDSNKIDVSSNDAHSIKRIISSLYDYYNRISVETKSQIISFSHPDIMIISSDYAINGYEKKDRKAISVDEIRRAISFLQQTPLIADRKFLLIDGIDWANDNATNALLKITEDYSDTCCIIMTAVTASNLPDTLISRCRKIALSQPSRSDIETYFRNRTNKDVVDIKDMKMLYDICGDNISMIQFCIDHGLYLYFERIAHASSLIEYRKILYDIKVYFLDELANSSNSGISPDLVAYFSLICFSCITQDASKKGDMESAIYYLDKYTHIEKIIEQLYVAELDFSACIIAIF